MNDIKSFEGLLRAATTKDAFLATCRSFKTPDVAIDHDALSSYAQSLRKPGFISAWDEYRTEGNDLETDFIELAVSTVQNAGYLYKDDKGNTAKWEINGSGAQALLAKMKVAREAEILPAIHIENKAAEQIALRDIFNGTPYAHGRKALWLELATRGKADQLRTILHQSATDAGGYHFDFGTLKALAKVLPQGLGEDPMLKKASLLTILFAGVAHKKLAPDSVTLDIIVPSDYRVPQTLHNIGALRFSDKMARAIESGVLLAESNDLVTQLRVQTILAVDEILQQATDQTTGEPLQMHHVDGELWFAGRLFDAAPGKLDEKKSAIRAGLEAHGLRSPFHDKNFAGKTGQAINVATLRF